MLESVISKATFMYLDVISRGDLEVLIILFGNRFEKSKAGGGGGKNWITLYPTRCYYFVFFY